jgi:hypothetical protein
MCIYVHACRLSLLCRSGGVRSEKIGENIEKSGANPTTVSYKASAVKFATPSAVLKTKIFSSENALAYYNALQ